MESLESEFPENWITIPRYLAVAHRIAATSKDLLAICEFCFQRNLQYLISLEREYANRTDLGGVDDRGVPVPPRADWAFPSFGVPDAYLRVVFGPGGFQERLSELQSKELNDLSRYRMNDLYEYLKKSNKECFNAIETKVAAGKIVWSESV